MANQPYDLIVIGAGPAGCSAAITAAQAGNRILLIESGRLPRHRVCGEFVSAESLDLLAGLLGSQAKVLLDPAPRIDRSRLFLDGRTITASVDPPAASIARFDLDHALLQSAERHGVEVRSQTTVNRIAAVGDRTFQVNTSGEEVCARAVINAAGRWSRLNPVALQTRGRWIGLKGHFRECEPSNSVDLYFFDGGYCGVQPVRLLDDASPGRINACAMVKADAAGTLQEVLALHPVLRDRSRNWQPLSGPVSTSPLIFRTPGPVRDRILMAGDAACFVDPFVGDGISLALRSGALAAECLAPLFRGELSLDAAVRLYEQTYMQRFASVFSTSSRIRSMLRLPRPVRKTFLFALERTPSVARYLIRKTR